MNTADSESVRPGLTGCVFNTEQQQSGMESMPDEGTQPSVDQSTEPQAERMRRRKGLSIPLGSRVPDPSTALATASEYDLYFQIERDNPGLLEWTRTCISIFDAQLKGLHGTSLTAHEKCHILEGILVVQRTTLERWVRVAELVEEGRSS